MGQGSGQSHRLAPAERSELLRLVRSGETYQAAARVVGCSSKSVQRLLAKTGGIKPRSTPRSALRLSPAEREELALLRKEVRTLRVERDVLKKAATFFAKENA